MSGSGSHHSTVIVWDISTSMSRMQPDVDDGLFPPSDCTSFELSKKIVEAKIRVCMSRNLKTCKVAVITFGGTKTDNRMVDELGEGEGYDGIVELIQLDTADPSMLEKVRNVKMAKSRLHEPGDFLSATAVAIQILRDALTNGNQTRYGEVLVVSDLDHAVDWGGTEQFVHAFTTCGRHEEKEANFMLAIIGYGHDPCYVDVNGDPDSPDYRGKSTLKQENEDKVSEFEDILNEAYKLPDSACLADNARIATKEINGPRRKQTSGKGQDCTLFFGDPSGPEFTMRVTLYKAVDESKLPSFGKFSVHTKPKATAALKQFVPPPRRTNWNLRHEDKTTSSSSQQPRAGASNIFSQTQLFGGVNDSQHGGMQMNDSALESFFEHFSQSESSRPHSSSHHRPQTFEVEHETRYAYVRTERGDEDDGHLRTNEEIDQAVAAAEAAMDKNENVEKEPPEMVPDELKDQLQKAYKLGKLNVTGVDENDWLMLDEPRQFQVLAFVKQKKIVWEHIKGGTSMWMVGDSKSAQSQVAISAFVSAMDKRKFVAIVRFTGIVASGGSANVHLALLWPLVIEAADEDQKDVYGFMMSKMAYAEDLSTYGPQDSLNDRRTKKGGPSQSQQKLLPSKDLLKAMSNFCDAATLQPEDVQTPGNDDDEDPEAINKYYRKMFNPPHRAVNNARNMRLAEPHATELPPPHNDILETFKMPSRVLNRVKGPVEAIKRFGEPKKVPPKQKRKKSNTRDDVQFDAFDDDFFGDDADEEDGGGGEEAGPGQSVPIGPVKISIQYPEGEYADKLILAPEDPAHHENCFNALCEAITDIPGKSLAWSRYELATNALRIARRDAMAIDCVSMYNQTLHSIKDTFADHPNEPAYVRKRNLWLRIVSEGDLGPITKDESSSGMELKAAVEFVKT